MNHHSPHINSTPSALPRKVGTKQKRTGAEETGIRRDMALTNRRNMQDQSSKEWTRFNTTLAFKKEQRRDMAMLMIFNRNNPLVVANAQGRTFSSGKTKFTLHLEYMDNTNSTETTLEMDRIRTKVLQHIQANTPDMGHLTIDNISNRIVVDVWGNNAKLIKGETGSTLRMDGQVPTGIEPTKDTRDDAEVGDLDMLTPGVPVTGIICFEGYSYPLDDPSLVRITWKFLRVFEKGTENVVAKVYTDLCVDSEVGSKEGSKAAVSYSALMCDL
jgi:hypothetical protein